MLYIKNVQVVNLHVKFVIIKENMKMVLMTAKNANMSRIKHVLIILCIKNVQGNGKMYVKNLMRKSKKQRLNGKNQRIRKMNLSMF